MSSRKNVIIDIVNSDCILKKVLYSYNVLTRCIRETPKRVLLRIVKAPMKCSIMLRFIRVYTVCFDRKDL